MKKYLSRLVFGVLGLVVAFVTYGIWQHHRVIKRQSVKLSPAIFLATTPEPKTFEWRQPLLHPTFPPKLLKGEKEFVLR
ncbi:MAG: hypothetical protein ABIR24_15170 [Verrucomicrobiota bacterium]